MRSVCSDFSTTLHFALFTVSLIFLFILLIFIFIFHGVGPGRSTLSASANEELGTLADNNPLAGHTTLRWEPCRTSKTEGASPSASKLHGDPAMNTQGLGGRTGQEGTPSEQPDGKRDANAITICVAESSPINKHLTLRRAGRRHRGQPRQPHSRRTAPPAPHNSEVANALAQETETVRDQRQRTSTHWAAPHMRGTRRDLQRTPRLLDSIVHQFRGQPR